jgi:hypothetical protein
MLFGCIAYVVGDGAALKQICARFDAKALAAEGAAKETRSAILVCLAVAIAKGGVAGVEGGTSECAFAGDGEIVIQRAILVFFGDEMARAALANQTFLTKVAGFNIAFVFVIPDPETEVEEGAFAGRCGNTRKASICGIACTFTSVFAKLVASRCCRSGGKLRGHANFIESAFVVCIVAFFV